MLRTTRITLEKKKELLERAAFSRSTLHNKINDGLWTPSISLGERAIAFIKYESDELLTAYINGYTNEEIKALVKQLVEERKTLLEVDYE